MKNYFITDTILPDEEICNLQRETQFLNLAADRGAKVVVYGRRNFGKTSVLLSRIIPTYKKKNKNCFVLFVDLYGVRTLDDIWQRIYRAFQLGYSYSKPGSSFLKNILTSLSALRPLLTIDPVSGPALSLTADRTSIPRSEEIFSAIKLIQKNQNCLLIFDEFQDIHHVAQAEGLLRSHLQQLPASIPVIMCGSKKHMLAQIFAKPKAPFSNFGEDLEFNEIAYNDYFNYMQERFRLSQLSIDKEASIYLQNKVDRVPEAINAICQFLTLHSSDVIEGKIESLDIDKAIDLYLSSRRGRFEEHLARFSNAEFNVIKATAKMGCVEKPSGQEFVRLAHVSQRAVSVIFKKFEDDTVIYKDKRGYSLSDPLLRLYIQKFH